jgi:Arc/MetJ-type ribon-helix-helix transcriptional regulator
MPTRPADGRLGVAGFTERSACRYHWYARNASQTPMPVTIRLPTKLEARLRAHVRRLGVSLSDFVRDAIGEKLEREPTEGLSAYDVGRHLFGKHGSGRADLSSNRKIVLSNMLRRKHRH